MALMRMFLTLLKMYSFRIGGRMVPAMGICGGYSVAATASGVMT